MHEPELGQMAFGQPWKPFEASNLLIAALRAIERKLEIVQLNRSQKDDYDSPFSNTGNRYNGEVFIAHAYSWNEEEVQPFNFKWKDIEVSWYKYLGRGTSVNREVTPAEISQMLDECIADLDKFDEETWRSYNADND